MKKFVKKATGFTLVELMVVVAIIGILSAVAVPNFRKYQAKSKTSEAKLQLSAVYMAMAAFHSDYNAYASCLNVMGFDPTAEYLNRIYAVGLGASFATIPAGAPTNCSAGTVHNTSTAIGTNASVYAWGQGKQSFGSTVLSAADLATGIGATLIAPTATTFIAGALGKVAASHVLTTNADAWTINQTKAVVNFRTGY